VHQVGFITCVYQDAQSRKHECKDLSDITNPKNVLCKIFAIDMNQISDKDIGKSMFYKKMAVT
jgi:hypothetical protein